MTSKTLKRGAFAAGLAVVAATATTAVTATPADARVCQGVATGQYVNVNPATRGITRLYLVRNCHSRRVYRVKIYGKCHPRDCSWRPARAVYYGHGRFRSVVNHGFAKRLITIRTNGRFMIVRVITNFRDPNRRDYVATYRLRRA